MVANVIPTRVHGIIDYTTSGALLAAPEVFRLKDVRSSSLAPRIAGAAASLYAPLTDYELGAVKALPMKAHLALDAAGGALLAASPWVLGYRRHGVRHWLPHTLVGLGEVAVALTSKTDNGREGRRRRLGRTALISSAVAVSAAEPTFTPAMSARLDGSHLARRRSPGRGRSGPARAATLPQRRLERRGGRRGRVVSGAPGQRG